MKKFLSVILACMLLLCGCDNQDTPAESTQDPQTETIHLNTDELFSDRDLEGSYEEAGSVQILFSGDSATCSSNGVSIDGSSVTITKEGTYILSGTLNDGTVTVNVDKAEKVQLVLNNASIHSETFAPIYILQADKVFLTLAEGSENTLSNGGTFTAIDDNNVDAVVFSKEDLTLNGSGSLTVTSPAAHGIVSKDELTVTGGSYTLTCASHGLTGKDSVSITGAAFDIAAGKDGIHAENNDDASLGFVYIKDGTYKIVAEGDGISASADMQIDSGSFDLLCGGGSENGQQHTSENWGNMGGGGRPGGMGGGMGPRSTSAVTSFDTTTDDSTSIKGIKAGTGLVIRGGTFTIDAADDALHSNADLTVNDGTFTIKTGDDGFHADETLTVAGGKVDIQESYEGLEGLCIDMCGGDISIVSSDDGLNAAGGTDQSGFGGNRGDMFGGSSGSSDSYITISGGTLFMNASGDGIDANGNLEITGGHITVTGPTNGDTAVLDYDQSGTISGGTFIGTGAYMMAQSLESTGEQGVIGVQVGSQAADTTITLTDSDGNTVLTYTPNLPFQIVILSSPDIIKGETYNITVGDASGTVEAS